MIRSVNRLTIYVDNYKEFELMKCNYDIHPDYEQRAVSDDCAQYSHKRGSGSVTILFNLNENSGGKDNGKK